MVILKVVFQHNTDVYKFISAAVDLFDWILVGTYRLNSHARLEAFVIQIKVNWNWFPAHPC